MSMQTAGTIDAAKRDPDAPIEDTADLFKVGDMFGVASAPGAALLARAG